MKDAKKEITKRQKQLLLVIYNYIKHSGYPPTFEEMRESIGVASNQSIIDFLGKLKQGKFIKKDEATARGITILKKGYEVLKKPFVAPLVGTTSAGMPTEAIEISGDWQTVSPEVAKFQEDVFLLKISGDSMINANIDDGDVVLVQSQKDFVSGDIVLAQMGDSSTVKRFISQNKAPRLYLKPENPKYENIIFSSDTQLTGKVISVLKNNQWESVK